MKRFFAAAAVLAALILGAWPAQAAGTISLSLSQQFDAQGKPLSGCKLYFYAAGTTTPQTAYQDSGLSIPWPWPMECDASGRLAQFFLADGSIKIRLTDKTGGYVAIAADNLLVIGPSSGDGGGGAVDATTVAAVGDVKHRYGVGPISGWVRANGRTIGSATSGASERANADTQALFEYLWNTDSSLTVSSGRGASANADWLANKTIALPDARGRALAALDDMGNSAAGVLTSGYFGTSPTVLGAKGGAESRSLVAANLPAHYHDVFLHDPGHSHTANVAIRVGGGQVGGGTGTTYTWDQPATTNTVTTGITVRDTAGGAGTANRTATTGTTMSASAFGAIGPRLLTTIYLKL